MESASYLFFKSNDFYIFAVYWQFVGTTYATYSYLFWNLHLAGFERAAVSRILRSILFAVSTLFCIVICTNQWSRLFYKKLVMGEPVVHGPAHTPWIVWVYGMLGIGYIISVINIIRSGKEKVIRIIVFSLFPLFPAIAAVIRSVSGVDELDYTPIVVAVSVLCMYLIVFRRNYVNLIPQSMESALDQTDSALIVFERENGSIKYKNRAAAGFERSITEIIRQASDPRARDVFDRLEEDRVMRVKVSEFDERSGLITITDITGISKQKSQLEEEIENRNEALKELEDKRRNIDAYLDSLYQIPDLKKKHELLAEISDETDRAFSSIARNLELAARDIPDCTELLDENIERAKETLTAFGRRSVSSVDMRHYISRNMGTLIIRGSSTDDSRKSLSPVRNRSAPAFNAARRIGRSFGSRIFDSASTASSGVETMSNAGSAV